MVDRGEGRQWALKGIYDNEPIDENNCRQCGAMLPDGADNDVLSWISWCQKCQYNFPDLFGDNPFAKTEYGNEMGLPNWENIMKGHGDTFKARKQTRTT